MTRGDFAYQPPPHEIAHHPKGPGPHGARARAARPVSDADQLKAINPRLKIAYHSDGVIQPVIPDLIEIGVDVLNPIQPACIDPAWLKRTYGDRLCFWGSIDEQHTLPFGTPADVRKEVLMRLDTIGKGGGLIIGPTHFVQLDTPMENFRSMIETITQTPYVCST